MNRRSKKNKQQKRKEEEEEREKGKRRIGRGGTEVGKERGVRGEKKKMKEEKIWMIIMSLKI